MFWFYMGKNNKMMPATQLFSYIFAIFVVKELKGVKEVRKLKIKC